MRALVEAHTRTAALLGLGLFLALLWLLATFVSNQAAGWLLTLATAGILMAAYQRQSSARRTRRRGRLDRHSG